jgi:hypothetical protein
MRRVLLIGLLCAGVGSFALPAQQHGSAAPTVAPLVRSAPVVAAPHAPAVAHAPVVNHAPVMGHAPVAHAPMQFHPAAHVAPPSRSRPVAPPHHVVLTSPYPRHRNPGNGVGRNNLFANNSFFNECSGAPGLGFDYTHFFAVHPNCNHTVLGGVVLPFVGGGFYVPMPYYDNSQVQPQQQQQTEANNAGESKEENESSEAAEGQEAHIYNPPVSDYVFVKRDGTKIFAVAYSLTNDKLQYVSKDGLRHTLSLDALDYEATEKSNEELGNTINLPRPLSSNVA